MAAMKACTCEVCDLRRQALEVKDEIDNLIDIVDEVRERRGADDPKVLFGWQVIDLMIAQELKLSLQADAAERKLQAQDRQPRHPRHHAAARGA